MIETVPLAKAAEAYGRMMRNEARFRTVLVTCWLLGNKHALFRSWSRMNSSRRYDNPLLSDDLVQSRDGQFHFFRFGPSDSPAQALN